MYVGVYRGEGRYSFLGFRYVSTSSQQRDFSSVAAAAQTGSSSSSVPARAVDVTGFRV